MSAWIRVTVATALVVTCLDGHAKVADKCVRMLEARPTRPDATLPRPCPMAIGHTPRPQGPDVRTPARASFDTRWLRPVAATIANAANAEPRGPALHG